MGIIYHKTNPYVSPITFQLNKEIFIESIIPYIIEGNIVDVFNREIFKGKVHVNILGQIEKIERNDKITSGNYILPGFIDSHVHIESSMLMPSEFARAIVSRGLVAVLSDPHEIANVLGVAGVEYFIKNGKESGFRFFFGAPSCVPASDFETSGAILGVEETEYLMNKSDIWFLAEMMNFPGVIADNTEIMAKINIAKKLNKPIDGHSPLISGKDLEKYIKTGISTDHECMDMCEAEEKIALGMKIMIREGSAAKNFNALYPLIDKYPNQVMFCTDDSHPNDVKKEYIDTLVKRSLLKGMNFFNVIRAASINPVLHYRLPVGLLREGDAADFIITDTITADFDVLKTVISGKTVYEKIEGVNLHRPKIEIVNNFNASKLDVMSICLENIDKIRVIKVFDGELFTDSIIETAIKDCNNRIVSSVENDVLKIVVLNRYEINAKPVVGFVKGFGLKYGALCSTVAHDSHNIIAVGVDDSAIVAAINAIIEVAGGIAVCSGEKIDILPLPIAGIISNKEVNEVADLYEKMNKFAKEDLGSILNAPFMTLSFMALTVIPKLKISDKGLFDATRFEFTEIKV